MRVEIKVTEADIAEGKPGSWRQCPIARAAGRSLPDVEVRVLTKDMHLLVPVPDDVRGSGWRLLEIVGLPPEAEAFVRDLDSGRAVRPLSFWIDVIRWGTAA